MGDIANPGNDVSAETDHIPNNAHKEINPFPVLIFIKQHFYISIRHNNPAASNVATS